MNTRSINRKVIGFLTELSDNKEVSVTQNKHIKVTGVFAGKAFSNSCFLSLFQLPENCLCCFAEVHSLQTWSTLLIIHYAIQSRMFVSATTTKAKNKCFFGYGFILGSGLKEQGGG